MFDLWKRPQLGFLERKIFSVFRKLQECFVKLIKIVIVLYVGSNEYHIQEKGKELFRKEWLTQRI